MGIIPIILLTVIGLGLLAGGRFPVENRPAPVAVLGLAFWVGTLAATFVMIVPGVVTGRLFYFLFYALLIGAMGLLGVHRGHALALLGVNRLTRPSRKQWLMIVICAPFLVFMAINVYVGVRIGTSYGLSAFDELGNFAMKGRLWYETGQLRPEELLDPEYLMYKRTYPPVVSMMESVWAYVMGSWNDRAMKWFFLGCWLATGAVIYGLLRSRTSALGAALGACFWFALPVNMAYPFGGAISGYADVPLALAFAAAVFAAQECHAEKRWAGILLMGLAVGGAFWVKKEGVPFVGILALWLLWKRVAWKTFAVLAAVWAFLLLVDKLAVRGVPNVFGDEMGLNHSIGELRSRLGQIWGLLYDQLKDDKRWGEKLWGMMVLVWVFKLAAKPWRQWLSKELFVFAAMAAVYIMVLLLTYYPFDFNLDKLFERLFLHILPLWIVATFSYANLTPNSNVKSDSMNTPLSDSSEI